MKLRVAAFAKGGEICISLPTEASVLFMMHRGCTYGANSTSSARPPHDMLALFSPVFVLQIGPIAQLTPPFWQTLILHDPCSFAVFSVMENWQDVLLSPITVFPIILDARLLPFASVLLQSQFDSSECWACYGFSFEWRVRISKTSLGALDTSLVHRPNPPCALTA